MVSLRVRSLVGERHPRLAKLRCSTEAEGWQRIAAARDTLQRLRALHPEIESLVMRVPISYAVVCDYGQGVAPLYCLVGERLASGDEAWRIWRPTSS